MWKYFQVIFGALWWLIALFVLGDYWILISMTRAGDMVERIWPPKGEPLEYTPRLVMIFFHGAQVVNGGRAWKHTWSQRKNGKAWEKSLTYHFGEPSHKCWLEWLPLDLGERCVVVYTLSYDADMIQWNGRGQTGDVQEIAKDLVEKLVAMYNWDCPIALVGHSFGGLVIKSLIVEVHRRATRDSEPAIMDTNTQNTDSHCRAFLENVKLTVFYGTPHTGSDAVKYAKNFQKVFKRLWPVRLSGILKNVQCHERNMTQLSIDFTNSSPQGLVKYNICEGRPVSLLHGLKEVMVVPYASAMADCGDNHLKVEDADHFEVCKPPDRNHISYTKLVSLSQQAIQ